jgi:glycosyltransferase involved in cell wall biosynthesis
MPPLRIAHVVLSLPVGGTERLVEQMVRNPPPGAEAACICLDGEGTIGTDLREAGFPVHVLGRKPGLDLSLPRKLARVAAENRYDILHCHQYSPWFYGALSRLFRPSSKVLLTEHGRFHPDIPSPKRRVFNKLVGPFSHGLVAVSPATRQALIEVEAFPASRVRVVLNGVAVRDPGMDRAEARRRLGLDPEGVSFILCARFDPIKWIPGLVEGFARVAARHPAAELILVGDGPEKPAIEAAIARLGLGNKVRLPGFRDDVPVWLRASDVFVLSSHSEGTSVSLIEAMSMGLPAVVTDVGGNPFVVERDRTALVVPPADAAALGDAMARLSGDADLRARLGAAGAERYRNTFRVESMFGAYASLYADIARGVKLAA